MQQRLPLLLCLCTILLGLSNCGLAPVEDQPVASNRSLAKFEPPGNACLVFAGQELEAIGGLENHHDGYLDHFERPAGFTMYTSLSPGEEMFGHVQRGLDGIWQTDNWGDGPSNMSTQLADPDFENMALAIGWSMVHHEERVAAGEHDALIDSMALFCKSLTPRPIFLRIGYEFDGHSWNHYDRESYLIAYKRIHDRFDTLKVDNVAYVWQSTGWVTPLDLLHEWYPGDEYVDWVGYSFFARYSEAVMIDFAREVGKPVFIAEATPTIGSHTIKFDGITRKTHLSDPADAEEAWELWFEPFFRVIEENKDIIKAISYINCHWKNNPMWYNNPTFKDIDARLQLSAMISYRWKEHIYSDDFINSSEGLYDVLWGN